MGNYSVLLVDDEVLAIRSVQRSVKWEEIQVGDVSVAYSMKQAQKVFETKNIDVMLCDIEMPSGSGLELLKWVHDNYPNTVTLFLTCHSDFIYAKEALELGAVGYILKPVPYAQLQEELKSAIRKREDIIENNSNKKYKIIWDRNKYIIEEQFWLDVLNSETYNSQKEIIHAALHKKINIHAESNFYPILLRFLDYNKFQNNWSKKDLNYALFNIVHEIFCDCSERVYLINVKRDICLVLLQSDIPIDEDQVQYSSNRLCKAFINYFEQDVLCYLGCSTCLSSLVQTYNEMLQIDNHNVKNRTHIYKISDYLKLRESDYPFDIKMKEWFILLNAGESDKLIKSVNELLDKMEINQKTSRYLLNQFYHNFLQMLYIALIKNNILAHLIFEDKQLNKLNTSATDSVLQCKEFIKRTIEVADGIIASATESQSVVEKAKNYIQNNLNEDLSREQISNYVYLNPDYLSRLFKKEEHISISEYICNCKIDSAKQMLGKTQNSISSIGENVGYSYTSHFSKIFKRETGYTPAQYRKLFQT